MRLLFAKSARSIAAPSAGVPSTAKAATTASEIAATSSGRDRTPQNLNVIKVVHLVANCVSESDATRAQVRDPTVSPVKCRLYCTPPISPPASGRRRPRLPARPAAGASLTLIPYRNLLASRFQAGSLTRVDFGTVWWVGCALSGVAVRRLQLTERSFRKFGRAVSKVTQRPLMRMSTVVFQPDASDQSLLQEIIGYLNFSSGASDPAFLKNLNSLFCRHRASRRLRWRLGRGALRLAHAAD